MGVKEKTMKILNFGSLNLDYVYDVDHFVRKGETIASREMKVFCGGKGLNQSVALSKAGARVYHAGLVGHDGGMLRETLVRAGVHDEWVRCLPDTPTGNAIIQRDATGDNCILLYGGANRMVTKEFVREVLEGFSAGDWLVLQNEISQIPYIVDLAYEKGMTIVLNPSPMDERVREISLDKVRYFLLNQGEAQALTGAQGDGAALAAHLRQQFPGASAVLTLGEAGSLYTGPEGTVFQKAYRVPVADTTAAGDTFTGYFVAEVSAGKPVEQALDMAARASAIAVSRLGAAPSIPERSQVEIWQFSRE